MLEAAPLAGGQWQGAEKVQCRGIKDPKCWVLLACGAASSRPLEGYSEGVLLTEHAGAKALELLWVLHSAWGRRPTG